MRLFERLKNPDKQIEIYDGYEHGELRPCWPIGSADRSQ